MLVVLMHCYENLTAAEGKCPRTQKRSGMSQQSDGSIVARHINPWVSEHSHRMMQQADSYRNLSSFKAAGYCTCHRESHRLLNPPIHAMQHYRDDIHIPAVGSAGTCPGQSAVSQACSCSCTSSCLEPISPRSYLSTPDGRGGVRGLSGRKESPGQTQQPHILGSAQQAQGTSDGVQTAVNVCRSFSDLASGHHSTHLEM